MRLIRTLVLLGLVVALFGGANARQTGQREDFDDIAGYYGFDEMEIIKLDWEINGLRVADFNRDGRNDIAVVNNRQARIELLLQKESVGPAKTTVAVDPEDVDVNQITPPTRFDGQSVAVSQKVFSFVCGDLNSDGLVDLAFYGEPRGLYVILQKTGTEARDEPGALSWRRRKKIKIDDGLVTAEALACADLNNDGADDLALAARDAVYIVLQKDDGSLAEPIKYPTTALTLGVKVGDLNGDFINDLVLVTTDSEKPIHVRFGLETGQLGPQEQFFIETPYALELYDVDGRVGDELLTVDARSRRLICYELATEKGRDSDWPILFYPLASGEGNMKRDLAVGDFDGDGLVDIVISEPGAAELIFYKQRARLGLTEPMRFPAFADIAGLSVADSDGDGRAELGVLSVKERIIGKAEFENDRLSFPIPIGFVGEPLAMEFADVDRDGCTDCVYVSKDGNNNRLLRVSYDLAVTKEAQAGLSEEGGLEDWEQADGTGTALPLKALASNPDGLKVVDVDQDGLADVLIFVKYELPILVRQRQKRTFEVVDSPRAQTSLIKAASLSSIGVADVDGRPGQELLVAQENFARSLVFTGGRNWSIIDQYNAKSTENDILAVGAFDIDGEEPAGRLAILLLDGQKGQLQILEAGHDKTYRFAKELDVGKWSAAEHLKILFAPFTGDGTKSILLFDSEKFALITPPGSGKMPRYLEQRFSYETKIRDGAYGNLMVGDINSDRRADIIMVEYKHNHIEILALDRNMKPVSAMPFKVFEQKSHRDSTGRSKSGVEPRELHVADVTADGKNDVVTVIHDRIIIYPQD